MIMKIGIIGKGFVGSAVEYGFTCDENLKAQIKIYDINPDISTNSLSETINDSDFVFISVPTPANNDGSINLDTLDIVLKKLMIALRMIA